MDTRSKADYSRPQTAKFAGFLFLFFTIGSILHFSLIDRHLFLPDATADISDFIKSNDFLFRLGIVTDLLLFITVLVLSHTLYRLLRPVNSHLALLAMFWILIETTLAVTLELSSFMALLLVNSKGYLAAFNTEQIDALLRLVLDVRETGNSIIILFFNLSFWVFFYLFFKSGFIPKALAVFGLLSCSLMILSILIKLISPDALGILGLVASSLLVLFQFTIGAWLLFKGVSIQQKE